MNIEEARKKLCPMTSNNPELVDNRCGATKCMWWLTTGWKDENGYICANSGDKQDRTPIAGHCSKGAP